MSSQDTNQYRAFLNRLHSTEERSEALNNIKNFILIKSTGDAIATIRSVGISKLVQCLNVEAK